jgi:hypothetical protein
MKVILNLYLLNFTITCDIICLSLSLLQLMGLIELNIYIIKALLESAFTK